MLVFLNYSDSSHLKLVALWAAMCLKQKTRSVENHEWIFLENGMLPSQGCCEDESKNMHDLSLKILRTFRNVRDHCCRHTKNRSQALFPKQLSQTQNQWEGRACGSQSFYCVGLGVFMLLIIFISLGCTRLAQAREDCAVRFIYGLANRWHIFFQGNLHLPLQSLNSLLNTWVNSSKRSLCCDSD